LYSTAHGPIDCTNDEPSCDSRTTPALLQDSSSFGPEKLLPFIAFHSILPLSS
jgi:hypothetical protein